MTVSFTPVPLDQILDQVVAHNSRLSSPIDSFAEQHILQSAHYQITLAGSATHGAGAPLRAGYCSVHDGKTLTQFVLEDAYVAAGQEAFAAARKLEFVREALVATCDEQFLSHCLDSYAELHRQAYFFQYRPAGSVPVNTEISYRQAQPSEIDLVREHSLDFFDESLQQQLEAGEIHIGFLEEEPVAFGVLEMGKIRTDVASIGMFTKPVSRLQGIGRSTLQYLVGCCAEAGKQPIAGCWYYNHNSKRTLESAGMVTMTRYLRFMF